MQIRLRRKSDCKSDTRNCYKTYYLLKSSPAEELNMIIVIGYILVLRRLFIGMNVIVRFLEQLFLRPPMTEFQQNEFQ